jgi:hypothetical protein
LWMSESAVVNQQTSYFITANAFLVSALGIAFATTPSNRSAMYFVAVWAVLLVAHPFFSRTHLHLS